MPDNPSPQTKIKALLERYREDNTLPADAPVTVIQSDAKNIITVTQTKQLPRKEYLFAKPIVIPIARRLNKALTAYIHENGLETLNGINLSETEWLDLLGLTLSHFSHYNIIVEKHGTNSGFPAEISMRWLRGSYHKRVLDFLMRHGKKRSSRAKGIREERSV